MSNIYQYGLLEEISAAAPSVSVDLSGTGVKFAAGALGEATVEVVPVGAGSLFAAGAITPPTVEIVPAGSGSKVAVGALGQAAFTITPTGAGSASAAGSLTPAPGVALVGTGSKATASPISSQISIGLVIQFTNPRSKFAAGGFAYSETSVAPNAGSLFASGALVSSGDAFVPIGGNVGSKFAVSALGTTWSGTLSGVGSPASVFAPALGATYGLTGAGSPGNVSGFSIASPIIAVTGAGSLFAAGTTSAAWSNIGDLVGIGVRASAAPLTPVLGTEINLTGAWSNYAPAGFTSTQVAMPSMTTGSRYAASDLQILTGLAIPVSGAGSLFSATAPVLTSVSGVPLANAGSPAGVGSLLVELAPPLAGVGSHANAGVIFGIEVHVAGVGSNLGVGALGTATAESIGLAGVGSPNAAAPFILSGVNVLPLAGVGSRYAGGDAAAAWSSAGALSGVHSPAFASPMLGAIIAIAISAGSKKAAGSLAPSTSVSPTLPAAGVPFFAGSFGVATSTGVSVSLIGAFSRAAAGVTAALWESVGDLVGIGSFFAAGSLAEEVAVSIAVGSKFASGSLASLAELAPSGVGSLYSAGDFSVVAGSTLSLTLSGSGSKYSGGALGLLLVLDAAGSLYGAGSFEVEAPLGLFGSGSPSSVGSLIFVGSVDIDLPGLGSLYGSGDFGEVSILGEIPGAGSLFAAEDLVEVSAFSPPFHAGSPFGAGLFAIVSEESATLNLLGTGSAFAAGDYFISSTASLFVFLSGAATKATPGAFGMAETLLGAGSPARAGALVETEPGTLLGVGSPAWPGAFLFTIAGAGSEFGASPFVNPSIETPIPTAASFYRAGDFGTPLLLALSGLGSLYAASNFAATSTSESPALLGVRSNFAATGFSSASFAAVTLSGVGRAYSIGEFAPAEREPIGGVGSPAAVGFIVGEVEEGFAGGASRAAAGEIAGYAVDILLDGAGVDFGSGNFGVFIESGLLPLIGAASNDNAGAFVPISELDPGAFSASAAGNIAFFAEVREFIARSSVRRIVMRDQERIRVVRRDKSLRRLAG